MGHAPEPGPGVGPYAAAASTYAQAGWAGVLPLPPRSKTHPPTGYSGRAGAWPTAEQVRAWAGGPAANICLRLPAGVVGLDVDAYGAKEGAATIAALLAQLGPLPPTWRTTSRDDGLSGIALYTIPSGVELPGILGPGIEVIQTHHRYALVWPSLHPEGRTYRWVGPDGATALSAVPSADDLPALPPAWVKHLAAPTTPRAPGASAAVAALFWEQVDPGADPCRDTARALERSLAELASGVARHEAMTAGVLRLAGAGASGHTGVPRALADLRARFLLSVDDSRVGDEAGREWARALDGATALVAPPGGVPVDDPCAQDFPGLIAPDDLAWARRHLAPELGGAPRPAPAAVLQAQPEPSHDSGAKEGFDVPGRALAELAASKHAALVAEELVRQRVRAEAKALLADEVARAAFTIPTRGGWATDQLALPEAEVAWCVDQVLPAGANVVLLAAFKAGKTTLVNHLAKALVDHLPFLGAYPTHHEGTVALFNYEVGDNQYRQWLREAGIVNTSDVAMLHLRGTQLPLGSPVAQEWLVQWLITHRVRTWVVDPFARAFQGMGLEASENDNSAVGHFLELLDSIKERARVSNLVVAAHTGRATSEAGAEKARGATRLDDWADARWILNKDAAGLRTFRATGRDVDTEAAEITHHPPRGLSIATTNASAARRINLADEVLSAVANDPGLGVRALRTRVAAMARGGCRSADVDGALAILISQHRVRREGAGGGAGFHHYLAGPGDLAPARAEDHDGEAGW